MLKIISISGLDGSGKSTQINLLKKYLELRGKRIFYFHAVDFSIGNNSFNVIPEFFRRKNIRNLDSRPRGNDTEKREDDNKPKSVTHANWLQIQLRKIALRIDIWRFKKLAKKLEKQNYNYILSDRFFWDTVVNINYLENKNSNIDDSLEIGNLSAERQDWKLEIFSFYLKTSPELIMNRERVPDQGLEYLKNKKKLYDEYFENFSQAKIIDGNKNKEEIFEEIKKLCQDNIS